MTLPRPIGESDRNQPGSACIDSTTSGVSGSIARMALPMRSWRPEMSPPGMAGAWWLASFTRS